MRYSFPLHFTMTFTSLVSLPAAILFSDRPRENGSIIFVVTWNHARKRATQCDTEVHCFVCHLRDFRLLSLEKEIGVVQ